MNIPLDQPFGRLVDLCPRRQKYLDAVVLIRIVRGADDDSGVVIKGFCQISDTGSSDNTGRFTDSILRRRACVKGRLDPAA